MIPDIPVICKRCGRFLCFAEQPLLNVVCNNCHIHLVRRKNQLPEIRGNK